MQERELKRRLRAIREPAPPAGLRARLEQGIPDSLRRPEPWWIPGRMWTMAKLGAAMVVLVGAAWFVLTLVAPVTPSAYAAVLDPVLQATERVQAVHLVMRVRTSEGEDFSFVDPDGEMMGVEAWIEWPQLPGAPGRARIEKSDRVYTFDGTESVVYLARGNEAFRGGRGGIDLDLFWPAAWVRHLRNLPSKNVEVVRHEEIGQEGRLLLREPGVDTDPRPPAFLGEFERETEVEWDLRTQRLVGLKRWIYRDGEPVLFSETEEIEYLTELDATLFEPDLPEDVRWGGTAEGPLMLLDLGPREVAWAIFDAALRGDRKTLELFCGSPATVDWLLEEDRRPTEVYFVGEPFRAGRYAGVYVPYKVRFGDGLFGVKQHNLALRNDNPQNRWVFDGGI